MSTPLIERPTAYTTMAPQMYIDGTWRDARTGATFPSTKPYSGGVWADLPEADEDDVDRAVAAARQAFDDGPWGRTTAAERGRMLYRLADLLAENAVNLALVESTDSGKLLREMAPQIEALPNWYRYFAGAADKLEGATPPPHNPNFFVYTRREPIGVVAAIVAWNSPLLQMTFKLAPALAAGCTMVVKPPEQASVSTLEFAKLVEAAGFPPGVFNVVTGTGAGTGRALVRHPGVDKVAFTGSAATGTSVMKDAADNLTRVTLELGGKSPNIVFDDADIDAALNGVVSGIFAATGQTCIAGSRMFVHDAVHDELVDRLAERARTIRMGDPLDLATEMGPVAFEEQMTKVLDYIGIGVEEGAAVAVGGRRPTEADLASGYFVEPTIFTGVDNSMRIAREEIFGPVLSVIRFSDEDDLVRQANDNDYGLAAGIWTNDIRRAHRVAHALRVGTVWINCYRTVSCNVPFGGYKASGIGRENGMAGLEEYTELKSVWLQLSGETRDPFRMG